jgi:hypothetical protein
MNDVVAVHIEHNRWPTVRRRAQQRSGGRRQRHGQLPTATRTLFRLQMSTRYAYACLRHIEFTIKFVILQRGYYASSGCPRVQRVWGPQMHINEAKPNRQKDTYVRRYPFRAQLVTTGGVSNLVT